MDSEKNFENNIINANEFVEKVSDRIKRNIVRLKWPEDESLILGSGFLCKINIQLDIKLPALITCYHFINDMYIKNYDLLYFSYFEGLQEKPTYLILKNDRIIYQNKELDVTIIQIKKEDDLYIHSFLDIDDCDDLENYEKIYLLHYLNGEKDVQYSQGRIVKYEDNYEFQGDYPIKEGASGCPIFDYENKVVIGIHREDDSDKKEKPRTIIILQKVIGLFIEQKIEEITKALKNENLYDYRDTMDLIYTIPDDKKLKLFNQFFIDKYKLREECKIYYRDSPYNIDTNFEQLHIAGEDKISGEIQITLEGIEYINDMSHMFALCQSLKKVEANKTDMSRVVNMSSMFERCSNLEICDVSDWNVENVKTFRGLFYKCANLKEIPGMNKWKPNKLEECDEMFFECCKKLGRSQIEQVEEWKDVSQNKKAAAKKGYDISNISDAMNYYLFRNKERTIKEIEKFTSKYFPFNKNK